MSSENTFQYTYSARENQEILNIRNRYCPPEETKLQELKRLDSLVQHAGLMQALSAGIGGCLLLGLGMCMAMEVIVGSRWLGVVLGLVGMVGIGLAYPVHQGLFARAKERYAPRILELANELSGNL